MKQGFGWLIDNMIDAHAAMNRCERYEFDRMREDFRKERKALEDAIAALQDGAVSLSAEEAYIFPYAEITRTDLETGNG